MSTPKKPDPSVEPTAPDQKPAVKKPTAPAPAAKKPATKTSEETNTAADPTAAAVDPDPASFLSVASTVTAPKVEQDDLVAVGVQLPPTLDYDQDVKGTFNGSCFTLSIYGEGCFSCGSLVPALADSSASDSEPACHFRFGNHHCPAAHHRIQVVGTRLLALSRVRKASASGDSNRLLRAMSKLEELSLEDKSFVLKELGLLFQPA